MTEEDKPRYCFDSSVLMMGWRLYYKPKLFSGLWEKIGEMMKCGSIVIPEEVLKEIGEGKDDLISWLKAHRSCVVPISQEQIDIVSEIVNKYPLVSQYKKPKPNNADPFIVAVGKIEKRMVITYEKRNGSGDHPKIPDLCKEYGVDVCDLATFFEKAGFNFQLKN
jgi:hypothetical protein